MRRSKTESLATREGVKATRERVWRVKVDSLLSQKSRAAQREVKSVYTLSTDARQYINTLASQGSQPARSFLRREYGIRYLSEKEVREYERELLQRDEKEVISR